MTLPDGRSYQFSYADPSGTTLWGALTQITRPDGSVHRFGYGNSSTPDGITPGDWEDIGPNGLASGHGGCPHQGTAVLKRRVVSETEYPNGLSGAALTTQVSQDAVNHWLQRTRPDGSVDRRQISTTAPITMAEEQWTKDPAAGGTLIEGVYNTYTAVTFGASTPYLSSTNDVGDFLVTKTKHVRDGYAWWDLFTYGDSTPLPTKTAGVYRSYGNITNHQIALDNAGAPGTVIRQTATTFQYDASYSVAPLQNLIRLPTIVKVEDGASPANVITRTDRAYDVGSPANLVASGAQHLSAAYIVSGHRGNVTSTTTYAFPVTAGGPATTNVVYFDNGAVQKTQDPKGTWTSTVTAFDFADCSASHTRLTATAHNALGHNTTSVHDCSSLKELSVTDPNGQKTCMQYDGLGRVVETAAPGDALSTLPQQAAGANASAASYVRDGGCALNASTTVGAGGAGPSSWAEYYPFGIGGVTFNQARSVTHTRDGTPDGVKQVQFVDGLGRSIEHCSEADPAMSSANNAVCTSTVYDNMGRAAQAYVPFYTSAFPSAVVATPSTDQYTQSLYDGIGRVTSAQLMKSGVGQLPATTSTYSGAAATTYNGNLIAPRTITTTTNPNGFQTLTVVDILGHTIFVDVQDPVCSTTGGFCQTQFLYDAAGRLSSIIDPKGNSTSMLYDGLGRKTQVTDPDRGTWKFIYDNNSNLTQQTDARGAVINLHYDVLNRITLRDLPYLKNGTTWVAGTAGEEDEFTYYDGTLPATCYSCEDHCSKTTTDSCNTLTLACYHTGTACTNPDQ
jgi:YD repeat-containing protein